MQISYNKDRLHFRVSSSCRLPCLKLFLSSLQSVSIKLFLSDVQAISKEVSFATETTISCVITGITKQLDAVVWKQSGTDVTTISEEDYVVSSGTYDSNSQTTTLTVKAAANIADRTYTCDITSNEWLVTNRATDVVLNVFGTYFGVYLIVVLMFPICFIGRITGLSSKNQDLYQTNGFVSVVTFEDRSVTTATDQTITCGITGLSAETAVTWTGPDDNEISASDTNNYIISQGSYLVGSKSSSLTIKTGKLSTLSTTSVFKCKLKSAFYPTHSPDVIKEMTLTLLTLGMFNCLT